MAFGVYRSVRDAARADVGRAIAMATGGALAFAPVEYVVTLGAYAGSTTMWSKLRLAALIAVLSLVLWLLATIALSLVMVTARYVRAQLDPERGRGPGWFAPSPLDDGLRRGVPRMWAAIFLAGIVAFAIQRGAAYAITNFKEPQLTASVIAALAIVTLFVASWLRPTIVLAAESGARALAPILRVANPLGRWRAAGIAIAALVGGALVACWFALPQSRSVLPLRMIESAVVFAIGMGVGAQVHARIRPVIPPSPLLAILILAFLAGVWFVLPWASWAIPARIAIGLAALITGIRLGSCAVPRPRGKRPALIAAGATLVLTTGTFAFWGADLETKYVAITASPALEKLITVVRIANDLDRDGYGTVLGEADCAPFDKRIHRGATDIPDDGIDQNCDGRDFSVAELLAPTGPTVAVPEVFKKPWNVLLITIDTVRYDRTSFGGYATSPKKRDTTPRLAELVNRSTSFTFANAPSAGTMASIPAILTSKFFHSGIAIDDKVPPGTPPKILPENTTLPEIMKRKGYTTGVIGSHEWWNDWGLEQGVDDYDNSIGKNPDAYRVAADKVTDHALAWISRQQTKKWFLWAHYIDPHGRYVAHPNVVDYGSTESDLYDSELRWTDQELGRLFDELKRLPSNDNTIIIITSDHGDSMAEHGIPLGTHGTALFREMLHVPLIIYIPNNPARKIGGAVTPLDIVPTIAALCDIDVKDLSFEGRSLVPQLFAGREDLDRIVFAETNAPNKQRAAISAAYKLIFRLASNVEELYDLAADPWEHTNIAPKNPPALAHMRQALQLWLDRAFYSRDPLFNQAFRQMSDVLSTDPPAVVTEGTTLAGGAIEVRGIGAPENATYRPGEKIEVFVYFKAIRAPSVTYRFQVVAYPATGDPTDRVPNNALRSQLRATADGAYATQRWKPGELIRDRFDLTIPADWKADQMRIGLLAVAGGTDRARPTGVTPTGEPSLAVLGVLPVLVPGSPTAPPP
ncbi:MAG: sulfatase-like hydrolase/transferase [Kofleriaceae bacterium]